MANGFRWEAGSAMAPATFAPSPSPIRQTAYSPVSDGVSALRGVLPGARVTSGYRGPDNPLSRKNPNSWHTRSHAAVDIAPIPGMSYQDAYNKIAGRYGIIEGRDEVNNPSKYATGPHWHFVLGNR